MSAINTQINQRGYYNLGQSAGSGTNTQQAARSGLSLAAARSATQTANAASSEAYLLDLSPEAQQYLNNLKTQPATPVQAAVEGGFLLSAQQKLALASLLEGFKDAPYTQDTFDAIQDELHQQGMGPDQMAAKYRANSFSTTATLVDALNGGNGTTPGSAPVSDSELEQRSGQYMQFILSEWKKLAQPEGEADEGFEPEGGGEAVAAVENSGAS